LESTQDISNIHQKPDHRRTSYQASLDGNIQKSSHRKPSYDIYEDSRNYRINMRQKV